ncbi:hypothetical protein HYE67_008040 [Fusarium culmorum]|uniref:Uncharacterized protein n=1 Tax=Fusarium culmorum TaxID=5516 RepID=A0A2T4H7M2_FUSCU|nr:hypothetical protein FCULG_00002714 [Fusarium culmorum]QPC65809.1 hypothetical protein HYE67_008040 [Fusarium culmorum]
MGDHSEPSRSDIDGIIFPMIEYGTEEAEFHVRNNASNPFQRAQVIQRTGHGVAIQCNLNDVVHGAISADSDYWASILVFQFRFDPEKNARRISRAQIDLSFDSTEVDARIPEVDSISFDGNYSFSPSKESVSLTKGGEGTVGASFGANVNASLKWERTVGHEKSHAARISGRKLVDGNVGPTRIAQWTLLENDNQKKGVPASIQLAVRIKRMDEAVFSCHVNLSCKADKRTAMQNFFGGLPKDDPILLQPSQPSDNRLMKYDVEELGAVDLDQLGAVTPTTMLLDAQ